MTHTHTRARVHIFISLLTESNFLLSRRLESATRSLKIKAPQRVVIESWANEISASCLTDLKLQSIHGAIRLDAKSVYVKGLKTAIPVQGHSSREQQQQQQQQQHRQSATEATPEDQDETVGERIVAATGRRERNRRGAHTLRRA